MPGHGAMPSRDRVTGPRWSAPRAPCKDGCGEAVPSPGARCRGVAFVLVALASGSLGGCGESSQHPQGSEPVASVVRSDSAGVVIVTSTVGPQHGSADWFVDPEPVLSLRSLSDDPAYTFHQVTDVKSLSDGGIAVADGSSLLIRLFDSDGTHRRSLGGPGDGPGEFRRINGLQVLSDGGILAFDAVLLRATTFSAEGEFREIRPLETAGTRVFSLRALNDSLAVTLTFRGGGAMPTESGVRWTNMTVRLFDLGTGEVRDSVATLSGSESFQFPGGSMQMPFGSSTYLAAGQGRFAVGSSERHEFLVFSGAGELESKFRLAGIDQSLPDQVVREELARYDPDDPSLPPSMREGMRDMPAPTRRPAFDQLLLDSQGYLWAPGFLGGSEQHAPKRTLVLTPDGEWAGWIDLPPRFRPWSIGDDTVIGVQRDTLGVEDVVVLRLSRGTGRSLVVPAASVENESD